MSATVTKLPTAATSFYRVAAARSKDDGSLTGWFVDSGFIDSTQEKIDRWGNRAFISERTWECLNKLRSILERQDYL